MPLGPDIHNERTFKCGGTLIAKNIVLTALTCVCTSNVVPSQENCTKWKNMTAMVGDHDIRDEEDQQIIRIQDIIWNENYTGIELICEYSDTRWNKIGKGAHH